MTPLVAIGSGISEIVGDVAEETENTVAAVIVSIINILKTILSYVYTFLLRFWSFIMENPKGAINLFANLWVMMV
jgi:hypothetical protein